MKQRSVIILKELQMDNAIKFNHHVSISLGFTLQPGKIEFFVKDNGIGIHEDAQIRIFEVFMQADVSNTRAYQGNGLGLTLAQKMAEMLEGKIRLQSAIGEGSIFYFTLPIKDHRVNNNKS